MYEIFELNFVEMSTIKTVNVQIYYRFLFSIFEMTFNSDQSIFNALLESMSTTQWVALIWGFILFHQWISIPINTFAYWLITNNNKYKRINYRDLSKIKKVTERERENSIKCITLRTLQRIAFRDYYRQSTLIQTIRNHHLLFLIV